MKNFKFLSSLALAGMLSTSLVGTAMAATTTTKYFGTYNPGQLVEGKTVVPFLLASAKDSVTINELRELGGFTSITSYNGTTGITGVTEVRNGDTFVAGGTTYSVVIYGDLTGETSVVDLQDVAKAAKIAVHPKDYTDLETEAANVVRDGKVDLQDVARLAKFAAGTLKEDLTSLEAPEASYEYTVTINKDGKTGIINKNNQATSKATVKVGKDLAEPTNVQIVVELDGTKYTLSNLHQIPAHQTEYTFDLDNSAGISALVAAVNDGTVTAKLVDNKGTVLSAFNFGIYTTVPTSTNAHAKRTGTLKGTLSLDAYGITDVTKVYYDKVNYGAAGTSTHLADSDIDAEHSTVKSLSLSGNKLDNKEIYTDLTNGQAYDIYYVVEDAYGNRSSKYGPIHMTKDTTDVQTKASVVNVKSPDFTKTKFADARYSWELSDKSNGVGETFQVNLYRNNTLVSTWTHQIGSSMDVALSTLIGSESNFVEGDYHITVCHLGDDKFEDSNVEASSVQSTRKVAPVDANSIKFEVTTDEDGNPVKKVVWDSNYSKDDGYSYSVLLYKYVSGKPVLQNSDEQHPYTTSEKELVFGKDSVPGLVDNEVYEVKVIVNAPKYMDKLDSDAAKSNGFYLVSNANFTFDQVTENSVRVHVANPPAIGDRVPTYTVEVDRVTGDAYAPYEIVKTVTAKTDKDGYFVIDGLQPGTEYKFRFTIDVEGVASGKSGFLPTSTSVTTKQTLPSLENLTVVSGTETAAGQISKDATYLYISGVKYKIADLASYPAALGEVNTLLTSHDLLEDDVFSYTPGKLVVKLGNKSSSRSFTQALDVLELTGDGYQRVITSSAAKKVVLKGDGALFGSLANITADTIELNNGVIVDTATNKPVTVEPGTITMDGMTATVSAETVMKKTAANAYDVVPNDGSNDITFVDTKSEPVKLTFVNNDSKTHTQSGTINVTAKGNVEINGEMNIQSNINVNITDGTFTAGHELTGTKNVTVTNTAAGANTVVTAKLAKLPEADYVLTSATECKEYTIEDDETALVRMGVYAANDFKADKEAKLAKFNEYIASFGLNGTHATITVNGADVTFTFDSTAVVSNHVLKNI